MPHDPRSCGRLNLAGSINLPVPCQPRYSIVTLICIRRRNKALPAHAHDVKDSMLFTTCLCNRVRIIRLVFQHPTAAIAAKSMRSQSDIGPPELDPMIPIPPLIPSSPASIRKPRRSRRHEPPSIGERTTNTLINTRSRTGTPHGHLCTIPASRLPNMTEFHANEARPTFRRNDTLRMPLLAP